MKIVICAIIKNEHRYLKEWIDYNLSIGFTCLYLYEDYGSKTHSAITQIYGDKVKLYGVESVFDNNCECKQKTLFLYFINKYGPMYDWCAFIDPDEYIRFDNSVTLDILCSSFKDYNGIYLSWKVYGANGNIRRSYGGVQATYGTNTYYEYHKLKYSMKSIVNLSKEVTFKTLHQVRGGVFTDGSNRLKTCYNLAWIDHYYTKSWEDWKERCFNRGNINNNVDIDEFFIYNKEIEKTQLDGYSNITLLCSYHKEELLSMIDRNIYIPYFTKSSLNKNIGNLQYFLCEYVTMYYAYRNITPTDYIGFCHYRRQFNKEQIRLVNDSTSVSLLERCDNFTNLFSSIGSMFILYDVYEYIKCSYKSTSYEDRLAELMTSEKK